MQQLFVYLQQQQQSFQVQMQAQLQQSQLELHAQILQTQTQFEKLIMNQGEKKKDPTTYDGKLKEDLELWIFATEEYYASKKQLMQADSSDFVKLISSNLGKSVLNWYRTFSTECDTIGVNKTWELFKRQLRARYRPKDFEFSLRERVQSEATDGHS